MRLILLGPPGAGKGTQAKILSQELNIPHISTGDILRDEVDQDSALGRKISGFVQGGELVPDDIVVEVVTSRLGRPDTKKGFILDGFPRTLNQAKELDAALKRFNLAFDLVIYFKTSETVCIKRLTGRRVCKNCGANFHIVNMPPKRQGICDSCGGKLIIRKDDKEQTVRKRLAIYQKETLSLVDYYKDKGKLKEVNGDLEAGRLYKYLNQLFLREGLFAQR